jgi:hypothetical protein
LKKISRFFDRTAEKGRYGGCFEQMKLATACERPEAIMNAIPRATFREILDGSRYESAVSAWERAQAASRLRNDAAARGNWRDARRLAQIKRDAIQLVACILPERLNVTLDSEFQIGLVSVRLEGHGRLHLPADVTIAKRPVDKPDSPVSFHNPKYWRKT